MLALGIAGGFDSVGEDRLHLPGPEYHWHDAAAVLVQDGEIVAAFEEERLNRIKHTNKFPSQAIRACLQTAGVNLFDVDEVMVYFTEGYWNRKLDHILRQAPELQMPASIRAVLSSCFRREFSTDIERRIHFVHHHQAHAICAFEQSGFDQSLLLTLDGMGDEESGMVFYAHDGRLEQRATFSEAQSLGSLYTHITQYLGFRQFDEFKVMGLAPYGDPGRYTDFLHLYDLRSAGEYNIDWGFCERLRDVGPPRRKQEAIQQWHMDLAAAVQSALESIIMHVLWHHRRRSGYVNLCLAGGVAHNSSANGAILRSGLFESVFVHPASHDAGCALGAALSCSSSAERRRVRHVYWGTDIGGDDAVLRQLQRWEGFIHFESHDAIAATAAGLLSDGAVIGWMQGRAEFGPRALGNRSILADPRPISNRDRINAIVKKREGFRPFAPAVIEEKAAEFFDLPPNQQHFPFMTFVVPVRPEFRSCLGAVTHTDGTARLQTVNRGESPSFWELLSKFGDLTGLPVLLNTSFNSNAEPIVDSLEHGLVCFLTTALDYLVAGNYLISKRTVSLDCYGNLAPSIPWYVRLERSSQTTREGAPETRTQLVNAVRRSHCFPVSPQLYSCLMRADGRTTLARLLQSNGATGTSASKACEEALALWSQRLLGMLPVAERDGALAGV